MSYAYDPDFLVLARRKARELSVTLREGVYCFFPGPQFETPAEVRAARLLGASASGHVHRAGGYRRKSLRDAGVWVYPL